MKLFVSLLVTWIIAMGAPAHGAIVGVAVPNTSGDITFDAAIQRSPGADRYLIEWRVNGAIAYAEAKTDTALPASGVVSRLLSVVAGDIVCVRVAAENGGGVTAFDESCAPPAFSDAPPIPPQPLVLSVAAR